MDHVDGNALAGPLSELFRFDMTTTSGECRHCGDVAVLARAMVYLDPSGYVARCGSSDGVMLTVVTGPERTWVDLHGISGLQIPR